MKVFKCKICEETILAEQVPDHCPFCGAQNKNIILAKVWKKPEVVLGEVSKKNLIHALQLEINNTEFYMCAASLKESGSEGQAMFKGIAKQEKEHAEAIMKLLGIDSKPDPMKPGFCHTTYKANLEDAHIRENGAVKFYSQAAAEATEPWIREFFNALVEIETNHIHLSEDKIAEL